MNNSLGETLAPFNFVLISPAVRALRIAAFVERGHGLVGGSGLNLHEEGFVVFTLGASGLGRINVFPCSSTSKYVIDLTKLHMSTWCNNSSGFTTHYVYLFEFGIGLRSYFVLDIVNVRTRGASEPQAICAFFYTQNVGTSRTEQQHNRPILTVHKFIEKAF